MICTDEGSIGGGNKYLGSVPAARVEAFVQILANSWFSYIKTIMAADADRYIFFSKEPQYATFEQGATAAYLVVLLSYVLKWLLEIVKSFERATRIEHFKEYNLQRVVVLDGLLKDIKQYPVKRLKEEIDKAPGFTPFWDRLESEQRWPLPDWDIPGRVSLMQPEVRDRKERSDVTIKIAKSAILAYILHTLLGTRDVAVCLKAQMKIAKQSGNHHLLSRAVEWNLADTVELLLVSGADPHNHGIGNLDPIHGETGMLNSEELHFSIAAYIFLKPLSMSHYWSFREDDPWARPPMVRARPLRKDIGPFSPDDIQKPSLTWIHVRRNNVS